MALITADFAPAEQLIRELQQHGITLDPRVERALALFHAANDARQISPERDLRGAYTRGDLTPEALPDRLLTAAVGFIATSPTSLGQPYMYMTNVVQELATITVDGWLDDSAEEHVETLSAEFNEYAEVVNNLTGSALTGDETPEQIIAMGTAKARAGIEARDKISHAVGQLNVLHSLINRVLARAGEAPLTASRLVDPSTVQLDDLDLLLHLVGAANWSGLARVGYRVQANSPEAAAELEARINAHHAAAEVAEWRPKIEAEAQRLISIGERGGLRPAWVLQVPPHLEYLIEEVASELDLPQRSRPRRIGVYR
jgi:hypothetical protein